MIDYMLMNLGLVAAAIGLKPEHVDPSLVPPKPPEPAPQSPSQDLTYQHRGLEGITIAESFYSPIRRTDFL